MLFEAKHGLLYNGLKRVVDFADGSNISFANPRPCKNFRHRCLGPIKSIAKYQEEKYGCYESDSSDDAVSSGF